jgi:hypothetical protein
MSHGQAALLGRAAPLSCWQRARGRATEQVAPLCRTMPYENKGLEMKEVNMEGCFHVWYIGIKTQENSLLVGPMAVINKGNNELTRH